MPLAVALAASALLGGCRAGYLAQLACEEARFLASAKPATGLLATARDDSTREALEVLIDVRSFAEAEGLDVGGSYREVADTKSASPFHVVTAAHRDRLEAFTWWYPVIGAIPYRGYFDRPSAERFAGSLEEKDLDTMIVEASAYSTLGWFDDPLPSSVLDRGKGAVAVTVLHEVVHQTFFAPGEVAFNETLATAVAYRLGERFWAQRDDAARAARLAEAREAWLARSDALDAAAVRLAALFADAKVQGWPRERLAAERTALYAELAGTLVRVDSSFAGEAGDLQNASFLAVWRYATNARAIDGFLAAQPSVAAALARLAEAVERNENLSEVVEREREVGKTT